MDRIILLLEHRSNRELLAEWLAGRYDVLSEPPEASLSAPYDLAIVDAMALDRLGAEAIRARRQLEEPIFLPFLLIVSREDVGLATRQLWRTVDELILSPVERVELQARVEILLRARRLSQELSLRNTDLEAFVQGVSHELRAPLRAIGGFARLMAQEQADHLTEQGRHDLERIIEASDDMEELIRSLLEFAMLGREAARLEPVPLGLIIEGCLHRLAGEIEAAGGEVAVEGERLAVRTEPALLQMALTNLLRNALKFVAPGVRPRVKVVVSERSGWCRIEVRDNGIGIPPEDQARVFQPFTRLHGEETYPGVGLGLATAYKAVRWMGGRMGMESTPGEGSTFWIEVETAGEESER